MQRLILAESCSAREHPTQEPRPHRHPRIDEKTATNLKDSLPQKPPRLQSQAKCTRMIALIQRVTHAKVDVADRTVAAIDHGVLALIGVQRGDQAADADRLLERLLGYRIFADPEGRMNLDLRAVRGGLLLVSQFTLAADTRSGTRPGFTTAAQPDEARALFEYLVRQAQSAHSPVGVGEFGAHMRVSLVNDGPVTFWLETGRTR